jgi:hypothetical protein
MTYWMTKIIDYLIPISLLSIINFKVLYDRLKKEAFTEYINLMYDEIPVYNQLVMKLNRNKFRMDTF